MKKILIILGITILVIGAAFVALRFYTKSFSPEENAEIQKNDLSIKVNYSRPSKKGRQLFGNVVPFNKVWRTGANEATEITFSKDVKFGGQAVSAGTYALFTIPKADSWTIILNSKLGQWGAFTYSDKFDVIRIEAPVFKNETVVEKFTISFNEMEKALEMQLAWDNIKVLVPIF